LIKLLLLFELNNNKLKLAFRIYRRKLLKDFKLIH